MNCAKFRAKVRDWPNGLGNEGILIFFAIHIRGCQLCSRWLTNTNRRMAKELNSFMRLERVEPKIFITDITNDALGAHGDER